MNRPHQSLTLAELQAKLAAAERLETDLSIASYRLAKTAEDAIGAAILSLPRDLWPYFTIGNGEDAVKTTPLNDARFEELTALEAERDAREDEHSVGVGR